MDKRYSSPISTSSGGSSFLNGPRWVPATLETLGTEGSSMKLDIRDDEGRGCSNRLSREGRLEVDGVLYS